MVIMVWLAPETRDPFKEVFKLPARGSTVLGGDSQQTDKEKTKNHQRTVHSRVQAAPGGPLLASGLGALGPPSLCPGLAPGAYAV